MHAAELTGVCKQKMREVGFEPTAKSLKGSCSTTELLPQKWPSVYPA